MHHHIMLRTENLECDFEPEQHLGIISIGINLSLPSDVICWPSGQYGLPMSNTGCPTADGFMWQIGKTQHRL